MNETCEIQVDDKIFVPYISEIKLQEIVAHVAHEISCDYAGKSPLFLVVLNGAFMFAADVLRKINTTCDISFIKLSSYDGLSTTGEVKQLIGLDENIEGRDIVIIEDIVDTGITLFNLKKDLIQHRPNSIKIATLFFKQESLKVDLKVDYHGMIIGKEFIVGYGLDYNGKGRNLNEVYIIKEDNL